MAYSLERGQMFCSPPINLEASIKKHHEPDPNTREIMTRLWLLIGVAAVLIVGSGAAFWYFYPRLFPSESEVAISKVMEWGGQIGVDRAKPEDRIVTVVRLLNTREVTDWGLKALEPFVQLETLELIEPLVTDDGLRELANFKRLRLLDLARTQVKGPGLKYLAGCENLQELNLENTPCQVVGEGGLSQLKHLQNLNLSHTKITDAGLKSLGPPNLTLLFLSGTLITDAGLKELSNLKKLETLDLSKTKVTDSGLKELAQLKALRTLNLSDTDISGVGLVELTGLTSQGFRGIAADSIY
jgi:internalin A